MRSLIKATSSSEGSGSSVLVMIGPNVVEITITSRNTRPTDVTEIEYRDYRNIYEGADI